MVLRVSLKVTCTVQIGLAEVQTHAFSYPSLVMPVFFWSLRQPYLSRCDGIKHTHMIIRNQQCIEKLPKPIISNK